LSIAKLCASDWLFQIASSAQYTEGAAGGWSAALGVFGSRTTSAICVGAVLRRVHHRNELRALLGAP
jgi:hypothetical protein